MRDSGANGTPRIGVYVCHCGTNIAGIVDVKAVAEYAAGLPGVVVSREYKYMCSDPGQELIQHDIRGHRLDRIIVASCSPLLHEHTFRGATAKGGLNPYVLQMVNLRENVSWVNDRPGPATEKAKDLVRAAAYRVVHHKALQRKTVPIDPHVLVVGAASPGSTPR
jgi:heterodisulfide reductase subunit A